MSLYYGVCLEGLLAESQAEEPRLCLVSQEVNELRELGRLIGAVELGQDRQDEQLFSLQVGVHVSLGAGEGGEDLKQLVVTMQALNQVSL